MKKTLQSILFLTIFSLGANAQWVEQTTAFSTASRIQDVFAVDKDVVWISNETNVGGTIELNKTTDGGTTWTSVSITGLATSFIYSKIHALDANTAWIVGYGDTSGGKAIYKTTDGGTTWTAQATALYNDGASWPCNVHFWDANTGVTYGDPTGGYFETYTTDDGGTTWTRVAQSDLPLASGSDWPFIGAPSHAVSGNNIWWGSNSGKVIKSTDQGKTWTASISGLARADIVEFSDDMNGIVYYTGVWPGQFVTTTDGGATWSAVRQGSDIFDNYASAIRYVPTFDALVAVGGGGTAFSADLAATWTVIDTNYRGMEALAIGDDMNIYAADSQAVGPVGGILKMDINQWNVGLEENPAAQSFVNIYPNPSNGVFTVQLSGFDKDKTNVNVYNILGEKVVSTSDKFQSKTFDLSYLGNGLYIVEVLTSEKTITKKILVK